ncbi:hypothetical protein RI129_000344 [Pyrocoelia pectoralis]|uniref:Uncharacterized protein n=1 Tax=Pyrocoelia pectoralis TaxID=417401 RepID=A0AAN7VI47_9COLE
MWMMYAAESWVKATDLRTAVKRLKQEFSALVFDAQHEVVYGRGDYSEEQCNALADKFTLGVTICDKFLNYKYCVECLMKRLNEAGLEEFANELNQWVCSESSASSMSSSGENVSDEEESHI